MRQKERKTTEKETRHQSRHDSLHCPSVKCNKFDRKTLVKSNKRQTGLKVFRFEIVKFKSRAFNSKIEIKPIPILLNSLYTANNHFNIVVRFSRRIWCTIPPAMLSNNWSMLLAVHYRVMQHLGSLESPQEARVALGYRLGQLLRFFRALQTSRVLHNSIVHAKAWTNC